MIHNLDTALKKLPKEDFQVFLKALGWNEQKTVLSTTKNANQKCLINFLEKHPEFAKIIDQNNFDLQQVNKEWQVDRSQNNNNRNIRIQANTINKNQVYYKTFIENPKRIRMTIEMFRNPENTVLVNQMNASLSELYKYVKTNNLAETLLVMASTPVVARKNLQKHPELLNLLTKHQAIYQRAAGAYDLINNKVAIIDVIKNNPEVVAKIYYGNDPGVTSKRMQI